MSEYARSPAPQRSANAGSEATATADRDLVVVSNRQPYRHTRDAGELSADRGAGGLTAGLDPALQRVGGTWVAWGDGEADREAVDDDDRVRVPPDDPSYDLRRVWLDEADVEGYYRGFANQVLWPVCHSMPGHVRCKPGFWERYRAVNDRFAEAAVEEAGPRSIVWLQDYHLALAAATVRRRLHPDATVAQFWHVPWPDPETFRACPHGDELLRGLLGNDVLGFHVPRYRRNFLRCVDAAMDDARIDPATNRVRHAGGVTHLVARPMGVEADEIRRRATSGEAGDFWTAFADDHDLHDVRVALGVDRLDYTKGIVERLRALEHLLETRPGWRGQLTYVQVGSETRTAIPTYRELQADVEAAVERIDDRFATDDWRPVVYTTDWLDRVELAGLYRHADLALVSPVRDGMNLVAQEYAAAQVDGNGVLVLSELAGAHDVFGDAAVSVEPADAAGFASRIEDALTMAPAERRRRSARLRRWVAAHDLTAWTDAVLRDARTRPRGVARAGPTIGAPGPQG
ncbi:MAG TPA: trehalose-6-phosphate synthase [Halobacteriales archaeon]|nr:trehalose-6-phosphate synthase [Halobacteriales archaeon]